MKTIIAVALAGLVSLGSAGGSVAQGGGGGGGGGGSASGGGGGGGGGGNGKLVAGIERQMPLGRFATSEADQDGTSAAMSHSACWRCCRSRFQIKLRRSITPGTASRAPSSKNSKSTRTS